MTTEQMDKCPKCGSDYWAAGQFRCNSLLVEGGSDIIQSETCKNRQIIFLTEIVEALIGAMDPDIIEVIAKRFPNARSKFREWLQ